VLNRSVKLSCYTIKENPSEEENLLAAIENIVEMPSA